MALQDYSIGRFLVTINGATISEWGETNPPFTHDQINEPSMLRQGLGGSAARIDRDNPGRRVTLNLQPGGSNTDFMRGLHLSKANITLAATQSGTKEVITASEGVITSIGQVGRAGTTITDDQYVISFNSWNLV